MSVYTPAILSTRTTVYDQLRINPSFHSLTKKQRHIAGPWFSVIWRVYINKSVQKGTLQFYYLSFKRIPLFRRKLWIIFHLLKCIVLQQICLKNIHTMCLPVYRLLCIDYRDLKYRFVNTTTKLIDRGYYMYDDYLYTCRGPDTIETSRV